MVFQWNFLNLNLRGLSRGLFSDGKDGGVKLSAPLSENYNDYAKYFKFGT